MTPATHRCCEASRSKSNGAWSRRARRRRDLLLHVLHAARHESRLSLGRKLSQPRQASQGGIWKCRWKDDCASRVRARRIGYLVEMEMHRPSARTHLDRSRCSPVVSRCAWRLEGDRRCTSRPRTMTSAFTSASAPGSTLSACWRLVRASWTIQPPRKSRRSAAGGRGSWAAAGSRSAGRRWTSSIGRSSRSQRVIRECREGRVSMDYQPGHPHGFCSAIWMGEVALCRPLSDPARRPRSIESDDDALPGSLREALIRRFQWEILFSIENAQTALPRAMRPTSPDARSARSPAPRRCSSRSTGIISSTRRARSPARRGCPLTVDNLAERVKSVWQAIGLRAFDVALTSSGQSSVSLRAWSRPRARIAPSKMRWRAKFVYQRYL